MKDSLIGKEIKNFQIDEFIGEGGFGYVYKGHSITDNKIIAIKIIRPEIINTKLKSSSNEITDVASRFDFEAEVMGKIKHKNIVEIFTKGKEKFFKNFPEIPYFIMEFVNGQDLENLNLMRKFCAKDILEILVVILEALDYAHFKGIAHRDIKPANIMISNYGSTFADKVKITDFGLLKRLRFEKNPNNIEQVGLTKIQSTVFADSITIGAGTLQYMPLEQIKGETEGIDHRADLFATGVMMYYLLTGKYPYSGKSVFDFLTSYIQASFGWGNWEELKNKKVFSSLRENFSQISGLENLSVLEWITNHLIAPMPDMRYPSANLAAENLKSYLSGEIEESSILEEQGEKFSKEGKNIADAIRYVNLGIDIFENDTLQTAERCNKAINAYTKAIENFNSHIYAYKNRGNAYRYLKDFDKAIADYTKAIELDPKYALAYNNRGLTYFYLREYKKAIEDFTLSIEHGFKFAVAYAFRGLVYFYFKEYDKAITDFTQAIKLEPKFDFAYFKPGQTSFVELREYEKAITDLTKAIEQKPKYADALDKSERKEAVFTVFAFSKLEKFENAIEDFSKSIKLYPKFAANFMIRGMTYVLLKKYKKAIADYTKVIELDPKFPLAYYSRGIAYSQIKEDALAIEDYTKTFEDYSRTMELDQNFAFAFNKRGLAYFNLKEYEKAIADLTKAIELDPENALYFTNRAVAYRAITEGQDL